MLNDALEKQAELEASLQTLPWERGVRARDMTGVLASNPPLRDLVNLYVDDRAFHAVDEVIDAIPAAAFRNVEHEERLQAEWNAMRSAVSSHEDSVMSHRPERERADRDQPWGSATHGSVPPGTGAAGIGGASFTGAPAGAGGEATGVPFAAGGPE